jgi:ubiquinone biosynthesis protein UbiJ
VAEPVFPENPSDGDSAITAPSDAPAVSHPFAAALAARALEGAIAAYLAASPGRHHLLAPLAGRVLALRLRPFGWSLWLCPTDQGVQVLTEFSGTPDAALSGDVSAFARLGFGGKARDSLLPGELQAEGDPEVVRQFGELFAGLDREEAGPTPLRGGGILTAAALSFLRAAALWGRDTVQAVQTDLAEFWQEETRDLPSLPEMDAFQSDVDLLRAELDRLESRALDLESRFSQSDST